MYLDLDDAVVVVIIQQDFAQHLFLQLHVRQLTFRVTQVEYLSFEVVAA
jgi:hypothetical protein